MPTSDNNQRPAVLVKNAPSTTLHLFVSNNERGTVFFACEQAPLTTFQSYGLPSRCPICRTQNPLSGEAHANRRGLG
jgi:hypothetical protein